jgi:hypothetical protein
MNDTIRKDFEIFSIPDKCANCKIVLKKITSELVLRFDLNKMFYVYKT